MSSNIVQFENTNTLPATADSLVNLASHIAATAGSTGNQDDLLRLQRDGSWGYGIDNTEPEPDAQWALNPHSFMHGYICWVDSRPYGEVMIPMEQPMPPKSELPEIPVGAKWDAQIAVKFQCIQGEDAGTVVVYKTTSDGGLKSLVAIGNSIGAKAQANDEDVVPLVTFEVDHYIHKKYGKIYTPEFKVHGWSALGTGADDVPAPVEVVEEPAPRRRRARSK